MITKDQWYERLKKFYPAWFLNQSQARQQAHMYAVAAMLETLSLQISEHLGDTFITTASEDFLAELGRERGKIRNTGELLEAFRLRVQRILNESNKPALKALIDSLLLAGEATIIEDFEGTLFCNRENFLNRGEAMIQPIMNTFSVIIDNQRPDPLSFLDREHFSNREDFVGALSASDEFFEGLVALINQNKALGVLYRLIERTGT